MVPLGHQGPGFFVSKDPQPEIPGQVLLGQSLMGKSKVNSKAPHFAQDFCWLYHIMSLLYH